MERKKNTVTKKFGKFRRREEKADTWVIMLARISSVQIIMRCETETGKYATNTGE